MNQFAANIYCLYTSARGMVNKNEKRGNINTL